MNLKRGILISLALYFATLVVGILLTILTKINIASPQNIPTAYWIITIVTTVILTCLASLWYFNKIKRNIKEGFKLGITFIIVGFILDLLFFFTQENAINIMKEYYSTPSFYIVLILVIASAVFIGSKTTHNSKEVRQVKKKE
ncbi:MAG: hypothetical protein AABX23_04995 [Nanoarchaeota archaeon]